MKRELKLYLFAIVGMAVCLLLASIAQAQDPFQRAKAIISNVNGSATTDAKATVVLKDFVYGDLDEWKELVNSYTHARAAPFGLGFDPAKPGDFVAVGKLNEDGEYATDLTVAELRKLASLRLMNSLKKLHQRYAKTRSRLDPTEATTEADVGKTEEELRKAREARGIQRAKDGTGEDETNTDISG